MVRVQWPILLLCAVLTACADERFDTPDAADSGISFNVTEVIGAGEAVTRGTDSQTLPLRGELEAGTPLCLTESVIPTGTPAEAATRGKQINDSRHFHTTMNVYAYKYASAFSTSDVLMDRLTVRLLMPSLGDEHWYYAPIVRWPTQGKVKFFAYTPDIEDTSVLTVSDSHVPTVTYTVPTQVDEQKDLMIADAIERDMANHQSGEVDFHFRHMLTSVQFKVRDNVNVKFTVKSITLTVEKNQATFNVDGGTMNGSPAGTSASYTVDLTKSYPATGGFVWDPDNKTQSAINSGDDTFIIIPQTCGENTKVKLVIDINGTQKELETDFGTTTWAAGYTYVYSISGNISGSGSTGGNTGGEGGEGGEGGDTSATISQPLTFNNIGIRRGQSFTIDGKTYTFPDDLKVGDKLKFKVNHGDGYWHILFNWNKPAVTITASPYDLVLNEESLINDIKGNDNNWNNDTYCLNFGGLQNVTTINSITWIRE